VEQRVRIGQRPRQLIGYVAEQHCLALAGVGVAPK
jgi:hypothetical protein